MKSQRIFSSCSEYLDKRFSKHGLHKEIDVLEDFLAGVKQRFRGEKAPPVVLRSAEGYHEEQVAIYQARKKFEDDYYG